ncbi:hypothetical protein BGX24_012634 [Mortierella sp. AD032]|nr:hypothetical protein BGX24_012634 [Mortierella sp. AD032]
MKLYLCLAVACASALQAVKVDASGSHVRSDADNGLDMDAAAAYDGDREANPSWKYLISTSEHEGDRDTFDLWERPHHRKRHQQHHHHKSNGKHEPHNHGDKHGRESLTMAMQGAEAATESLTAEPTNADTTSTTSPITYDAAKACLDANFPFPVDNRAKTAESIKKLLLNSFVFEDLAASPPSVPGLTLKAAPVARDIDALRANTVQTPRQFHEGISDIMIKARDAHLAYSADCFNQFSFDHGFTFADLIEDSGARSLRVVSVQPTFSKLSSLQFSPLGCSVVKINDVSAYQFIQTWADNSLDISKAAAIRYNSAVGGPIFDPQQSGFIVSGQFSRRNRLPAESSLKFGFICPQLWGSTTVKQVVVKWEATFQGSPHTVSQYYTTYCSAKSPTTASSTTTSSGNQDMALESSEGQDQNGHQQQHPFNYLPEPAQEDAINKVVEEFKAMPNWLAKRTQEVILGPATVEESKIEWTDEMDEEVLRAQAERMLREMPAFEPVPKIPLFDPRDVHRTTFHRFTASAQGYRVLRNSPLGVHAILLEDNTTGVIIIPSFNPGGDTALAQFYASLIEAISVLRPIAEKLIIDLSRNGGGSTCLSRRALELFFPETPQVVTNFRRSDLETLFLQTGVTPASSYLRSTDGTVADSAYISTTVSHSNRQFNLTNYVVDNCASFKYGKLPVDPTEESERPRAVKGGYVYDPNAVYHPWDAEDIIIFDEGTCGSACATFANQMHQKNKVKAVVASNAEGTNKTAFSSFPGGQVLKAEVYFEVYKAFKNALGIQALPDPASQAKDTSTGQLDDSLFHDQATFSLTQGQTIVKLLPEPLQQSANLTISWRQTYNTGDAQILFKANSAGKIAPTWSEPSTWTEYSFLPADFHIPFTLNSYVSYHHLWEDARDAVWN